MRKRFRAAGGRKRVYIAGPITQGVLADNVNQGTQAFVDLARAGLAPLCPMWSVYAKPAVPGDGNTSICIGTVSGNTEMTLDDWMGVDLPWVAVADAVLRLPGESRGADREVAEAIQCQIPIFYSVADVLTWKNTIADWQE